MLWRVLLITLILSPLVIHAQVNTVDCLSIAKFIEKQLAKGPVASINSCEVTGSKKEFYTLSLTFKSGEVCKGIAVWARGYKEEQFKLQKRGDCRKV